MTEQTLKEAAESRGIKIGVLRGGITMGEITVVDRGHNRATVVTAESVDEFLRRDAKLSRIILAAVGHNPMITTDELARLIGRSNSNAHYRVQKLIKTGSLVRTGRRLDLFHSDWEQDDWAALNALEGTEEDAETEQR